jgi:hypothetical protein
MTCPLLVFEAAPVHADAVNTVPDEADNEIVPLAPKFIFPPVQVDVAAVIL